MIYNAQIGQDKLVDFLFNKKNNGSFLDIGAQDPMELNNTYFFEKYREWTGLAVERSSMWTSKWHARDKTTFVCADARNVKYLDFLKYKSIEVVDYISLDLDPSSVTLEMLKLLIKYNIKFKVMTFEVDAYTSKDTKEISTNILNDNGYEKIHELYYTYKHLNNVHVDDVWINKEYKEELNISKELPYNLEYNFGLEKFTNFDENRIK